jgi:hypothetical protein
LSPLVDGCCFCRTVLHAVPLLHDLKGWCAQFNSRSLRYLLETRLWYLTGKQGGHCQPCQVLYVG